MMPVIQDNTGISSSPVTVSNFMASGTFDLSPISGLQPNAKFQGNRVSDITSAYQTYLANSPIGKGGQYAVSAQQKYGYNSISDAAQAYLQAAGLTFTPNAAPAPTPTPTPTPDNTLTNTITDLQNQIKNLQNTLTTTSTPTPTPATNPLQSLLDVLPTLFGSSVYNPPLQSQVYGYTPDYSGGTAFQPSQPITTQPNGGIGIGTIVILAIIGIAGYFLYKKFAG